MCCTNSTVRRDQYKSSRSNAHNDQNHIKIIKCVLSGRRRAMIPSLFSTMPPLRLFSPCTLIGASICHCSSPQPLMLTTICLCYAFTLRQKFPFAQGIYTPSCGSLCYLCHKFCRPWGPALQGLRGSYPRHQ
jgi:hypothetical protein